MNSAKSAARSARSARWLIVDSNPEMLAIMREVATLFTDAPVDCCGTPHAAIAAFNLEPDQYGFVITDSEMPGMNGTELCQRLRETSPALKVLLATGKKTLTMEEARKNGFCGSVLKPFALVTLENALTIAGIAGAWKKAPVI